MKEEGLCFFLEYIIYHDPGVFVTFDSSKVQVVQLPCVILEWSNYNEFTGLLAKLAITTTRLQNNLTATATLTLQQLIHCLTYFRVHWRGSQKQASYLR